MTKTQYVEEILSKNFKDDVKSYFLVHSINISEGKDGRSFLTVTLSDNSGKLEARKWQEAKTTFERVKAGDIVSVQGKINIYQGRAQLIISEIFSIDNDLIEKLGKDQFYLKSQKAPDEMYSSLIKIVKNLDEFYIRDLLLSILSDSEIKYRLKLWPAGKSIHHAYESGLLEHILSCTELALFLSPRYTCNTSYVVAGTILHDLCKIYELTTTPSVEYSDEGKLIGHLIMATEILDEHARKITNFPLKMKMHLKHILLSHHGEYEYGSPKVPATSEAFLVHLIDLMDSKMASLNEIKKNDSSTTSFTGLVRHLDRAIFKDQLPSYTEQISNNSAFSKLKGFKIE